MTAEEKVIAQVGRSRDIVPSGRECRGHRTHAERASGGPDTGYQLSHSRAQRNLAASADGREALVQAYAATFRAEVQSRGQGGRQAAGLTAEAPGRIILPGRGYQPGPRARRPPQAARIPAEAPGPGGRPGRKVQDTAEPGGYAPRPQGADTSREVMPPGTGRRAC